MKRDLAVLHTSMLTSQVDFGVMTIIRWLFALMASTLVPAIHATVEGKAMLERRGSDMGLHSVMLRRGPALRTLAAGIAHPISRVAGIFEISAATFLVPCAASLILCLELAQMGPRKPL
ncbi:MAG: hypothetical protein ABSB26_01015 [Nitrososphaerales archaeon]